MHEIRPAATDLHTHPRPVPAVLDEGGDSGGRHIPQIPHTAVRAKPSFPALKLPSEHTWPRPLEVRFHMATRPRAHLKRLRNASASVPAEDMLSAVTPGNAVKSLDVESRIRKPVEISGGIETRKPALLHRAGGLNEVGKGL